MCNILYEVRFFDVYHGYFGNYRRQKIRFAVWEPNLMHLKKINSLLQMFWKKRTLAMSYSTSSALVGSLLIQIIKIQALADCHLCLGSVVVCTLERHSRDLSSILDRSYIFLKYRVFYFYARWPFEDIQLDLQNRRLQGFSCIQRCS